jgi:hypothetical protein
MPNILNPSSTRPYSITFYLKNSSSTQTVSTSLTVTSPRSSSFVLDSLSDTTTSSFTSNLYFNFQNYISPTTILNITYDSKLVGITLNSRSTYSIVSDSSGVKRLNGWNTDLREFGIVSLNVSNIDFAIQYTMTGTLYFIFGSI